MPYITIFLVTIVCASGPLHTLPPKENNRPWFFFAVRSTILLAIVELLFGKIRIDCLQRLVVVCHVVHIQVMLLVTCLDTQLLWAEHMANQS